MQLQVWVQQVRVNNWTNKTTGKAQTDHLLVCMDNDDSGENIATAFEYVLTPEETKALEGKSVRGKSVTLACNDIRMVGTTLKLRGRMLKIEGKAITDAFLGKAAA
jgi:hypothetical protein